MATTIQSTTSNATGSGVLLATDTNDTILMSITATGAFHATVTLQSSPDNSTWTTLQTWDITGTTSYSDPYQWKGTAGTYFRGIVASISGTSTTVTLVATPNVNVSSDPANQLLFVGRNLNFAATTDQVLNKTFGGTKFMVTHIVAAWKSGSGSVACAGGIYDAASKGGTALVAATQSWVTLATGVIVNATLAAAAGTTLESVSTLYLSLTTGSSTAVTADVFVYGVSLD